MLNALLLSRQAYSVFDQILLSLTNLVASYLILLSVGAEIFGLYSFLMVVCNFISGSFSSILHGQMTLRIAGKRQTLIKSNFLSTFVLYLSIFCVFFVLFGCVVATVDSIPYFQDNKRAIVAAVFFSFLLSLFDLFRKYTYVMDRQDISVVSTAVYFVLLVLGMSFVQLEESSALFTVFIIFCISKSIALCVNYLCLATLLSAKSMNLSARLTLLSRYWRQGKFSFLGMLTSWVQNQGITPFLMFVAGPLIVGYFNLARLLTVPVTVVNAGLINSALPRLRETYKQSGFFDVQHKVFTLININVVLSGVYFLVLFAFHYVGILDRVFPDYQEAIPFLVIWSFVATSILYRSWLTQQYVVSMKFKFLLFTGIASASITYILIGILYVTTQNYYTVPVAVWLGETFLIVLLRHQRKRMFPRVKSQE